MKFDEYISSFTKLNYTTEEIVINLLNMFYLEQWVNCKIFDNDFNKEIKQYIREEYDVYEKCIEDFQEYIVFDPEYEFKDFKDDQGSYDELNDIIYNFCAKYSDSKNYNIIRFLSQECTDIYYRKFKSFFEESEGEGECDGKCESRCLSNEHDFY